MNTSVLTPDLSDRATIRSRFPLPDSWIPYIQKIQECKNLEKRAEQIAKSAKEILNTQGLGENESNAFRKTIICLVSHAHQGWLFDSDRTKLAKSLELQVIQEVSKNYPMHQKLAIQNSGQKKPPNSKESSRSPNYKETHQSAEKSCQKKESTPHANAELQIMQEASKNYPMHQKSAIQNSAQKKTPNSKESSRSPNYKETHQSAEKSCQNKKSPSPSNSVARFPSHTQTPSATTKKIAKENNPLSRTTSIEKPKGKEELTHKVQHRQLTSKKPLWRRGFSFPTCQTALLFPILTVYQRAFKLCGDPAMAKQSILPPQNTTDCTPLPQKNTPLLPPVGFGNLNQNCWINALMQMIINTPSLLNAYLVIGKYYQEKGNTKEQEIGNHLLSAYQSYLEASEKKQPVANNHTQNIRLFFHHFWRKEIAGDPKIQEDANTALMLLMTRYEYVLKLQSNKPRTIDGMPNPEYHDIVPNFYFSTATRAIYRPDKESSYSPVEGKRYGNRVDPETGCFVSFATSQDFRISLTLADDDNITFSTLLSKYFENLEKGDSDLIECQWPNGQIQKFRKEKDLVSLDTIPSELILTLERITSKGKKINSPVPVPEILVLKENAFYQLTSFVVHEGRSADRGHYIAYRHQEDGWYCCNDSQVTKANKEEVETALQSSYFHHYNRVIIN